MMTDLTVHLDNKPIYNIVYSDTFNNSCSDKLFDATVYSIPSKTNLI